MRGKLPVNIMTAYLAQSIKRIKISTVLGAVYSDNTVANYNRHVHFGTRRMKPRPFLQAAVDERRPAILNRMKYEIMKEINKAGRA
jgi:HK97 gp10 family phage protein